MNVVVQPPAKRLQRTRYVLLVLTVCYALAFIDRHFDAVKPVASRIVTATEAVAISLQKRKARRLPPG